MPRQHLPARADAMVRANQTHEDAVRVNPPQADEQATPAQDPQAKAARVFKAALKNSGRTSKEASFSLGVSAGLVDRMCHEGARETLSTTQLFTLCRDLGPRFTWEYHVAYHHEQKLAKQALNETLRSLSLIAVGLD